MSTVDVEPTWKWGPFSAALAAGLAAAVLVMLERVIPTLPDYLVWCVSGPMAALALVLGKRTRGPMVTGVFQAACWILAGIWVSATVLLGQSTTGWVVLGVGCAVLAKLAPAFSEEVVEAAREEAHQAAIVRQNAVSPDRLRYAALINKGLGLKKGEVGVSVDSVKPWPTGGGEDVEGEFPMGSLISLQDLADLQVKLAAGLRLLDGCTIETVSGAHQGAWKLRVTTADVLADNVPYPNDYRPRRAKDDIPLGRKSYGDVATVNTYQDAGAFVAMRNGGKTVLLHNLQAGMHQAWDNVVWGVDLGGGGAFGVWNLAWLRGLSERPAVDMIASKPATALRMSEWLLAIAYARKGMYQSMMADMNVDVLPIGERLPDGTVAYQITVIVDEGGEMFGDSADPVAARAAANFRAAQRIGRAMGIQVHFSLQRGISTYCDSDMLKSTSIKAVGKVQDESELAYVMDWGKGIRVSDLVRKGEFWLYRMEDPRPFKIRTYSITPQQIMSLSIWCAANGTLNELDPVAQAIIGVAEYAKRWELEPDYIAALRRNSGTAILDPSAGVVIASVAHTTPEEAVAQHDTASRVSAMIAEIEREAAEEESDEPAEPDLDEELLAKFRAEIEEWSGPSAPDPDAASSADPLPRPTIAEYIVAKLSELGETKRERLVALAMHDRITDRPPSISESLAQLKKKGRVISTRPGFWKLAD